MPIENTHEVPRPSLVATLFGTLAALRPLDLTLEVGKIYFILGETGDGKSILLCLLAGVSGFEPLRRAHRH